MLEKPSERDREVAGKTQEMIILAKTEVSEALSQALLEDVKKTGRSKSDYEDLTDNEVKLFLKEMEKRARQIIKDKKESLEKAENELINLERDDLVNVIRNVKERGGFTDRNNQ